MYRAPSGAMVLATGTLQWAWGLDGHHDINDPPRANAYDIRLGNDPLAPDAALQQATVNVLADMDIQVCGCGAGCTTSLFHLHSAASDPLHCLWLGANFGVL